MLDFNVQDALQSISVALLYQPKLHGIKFTSRRERAVPNIAASETMDLCHARMLSQNQWYQGHNSKKAATLRRLNPRPADAALYANQPMREENRNKNGGRARVAEGIFIAQANGSLGLQPTCCTRHQPIASCVPFLERPGLAVWPLSRSNGHPSG